jgi:uncharacterized membrane protein YeaQ/YmgE (transglycosylase-associated protein family)
MGAELWGGGSSRPVNVGKEKLMDYLLFWIVVGIVAGLLAKSVVPGEGPGGILGDLVVGVIGAFLGGWMFQTFLGHSYHGWIGSTAVAFIGAVVLLLVLRAIAGRRMVTR